MRRVLVLGPTGAGKSTLAAALGARLGYSVHHLDKHYYLPGWRPRDREEWERVQRDLVAEASWVIDGNYGSSLHIRLAAADTAVLLDPPPLLCVWRVISRRLRYRDAAQPFGAPGCVERFDRSTFQLLHYTLTYRGRHRDRVLALLDGWRGQVYHLTGVRGAERFLGLADARSSHPTAAKNGPWFGADRRTGFRTRPEVRPS